MAAGFSRQSAAGRLEKHFTEAEDALLWTGRQGGLRQESAVHHAVGGE